MVKLDNDFGSQQNQQTFNQQSAQSQQQASFNSQAQNQTQQSAPPLNQKGLLTLPPAVLQMVPWIPFALEAMTGQKVPSIGGTIGEIQVSLQKIQANLAQILQTQAQIWNKLTNLENNASNQLTNLEKQITNTNNSFRLLATETKRSLEFNNSQPKPNLEKDLY